MRSTKKFRPLIVYDVAFDAPEALRNKALQIAIEIAREHGKTLAQVLSRSRRSELVLPRHQAWLRCQDELGLAYTEIGRLFCRDHTTVMHALKKLRAAA